MADGFKLNQFIRPGQQIFTALKKLSAKIRSQTIAKYRHIQIVHNVRQLRYLSFGEKLALINQNATQTLCAVLLSHQIEEFCLCVVKLCRRRQADSRTDFTLTIPVIEFCC